MTAMDRPKKNGGPQRLSNIPALVEVAPSPTMADAVEDAGSGQSSNAHTSSATHSVPNMPLPAEPDVQQLACMMSRASVEAPTSTAVAALLAAAKQLQAQKQGIKAEQCYSSVLALDASNFAALQGLVQLWLAADKPVQAQVYAQRAVDAAPADAAAHQLLGDCHLASGQAAAAVEAYQQALATCTEGSTQELDLHVSLSQALCQIRPSSRVHKEAAAQLVMGVLEASGQSHQGALLQYANMAVDRCLWSEAVGVALRLLVAQPGSRQVKRVLAQALQEQEGMQALLGVLAASRNGPDANALAFVGNAVKDEGGVDVAVQLTWLAVQADPCSAGLALALMHALELQQALQKVLDVAVAFCESSCSEDMGGKINLGDVAALLKGLPPLRTLASSGSWLDSEPWHPPPSLAERRCIDPAALRCVDAAAGPLGISMGPHGEDASVCYSSGQLDLLALLFTAVKVLFCGGALARAVRLCAIIEPARRASKEPLHTTPIRNEAAYYTCVQQLLYDHPPPVREPEQARMEAAAADGVSDDNNVAHDGMPQPLFVCGDSHCLSAAWREVRMGGRTRVLRPLLVTGLKVWHLRPESNFYTKAQFWTTIKHLPAQSQVIMLFGEIDCREGLLSAGQLKYANMDEALQVTVDTYVSVLLQLVSQHSLEVYVHPVPPVLNETRHIVKPFNMLLSASVAGAVQLLPAELALKLHMLDFGAMLLSEDGSALRPGLELDGTHLAPAYLQHLQASLDDLQHSQLLYHPLQLQQQGTNTQFYGCL